MKTQGPGPSTCFWGTLVRFLIPLNLETWLKGLLGGEGYRESVSLKDTGLGFWPPSFTSQHLGYIGPAAYLFWVPIPHLKVKVLVSQLCTALWDPMDCSRQVPVSRGFSRQEYWSGLPFPPLGDLPDPGIKHWSLHCRRILYILNHQGGPISLFNG